MIVSWISSRISHSYVPVCKSFVGREISIADSEISKIGKIA